MARSETLKATVKVSPGAGDISQLTGKDQLPRPPVGLLTGSSSSQAIGQRASIPRRLPSLTPHSLRQPTVWQRASSEPANQRAWKCDENGSLRPVQQKLKSNIPSLGPILLAISKSLGPMQTRGHGVP